MGCFRNAADLKTEKFTVCSPTQARLLIADHIQIPTSLRRAYVCVIVKSSHSLITLGSYLPGHPERRLVTRAAFVCVHESRLANETGSHPQIYTYLPPITVMRTSPQRPTRC